MTVRQRLSRDDVVDAAIAIGDADGFSAIRLNVLADLLGIKPPSLYTHVDSLDDVLDEVAVRCTIEFADVLRDSVMGKAGAEGVRSFAAAWRSYVVAHPERYAATLRHPSNPSRAAIKAAGAGATRAALATIESLGVPSEQLPAAARTLRATLHGISTLEAGASLQNQDDVFEMLVEVVLTGLRALGSDASD